jgi:hypothetical protein
MRGVLRDAARRMPPAHGTAPEYFLPMQRSRPAAAAASTTVTSNVLRVKHSRNAPAGSPKAQPPTRLSSAALVALAAVCVVILAAVLLLRRR